MTPPAATTWRVRVWRALDPRARAKGLSPTNLVLAGLILASVGLAVLETEVTMARFAGVMRWLEVALGLVFALEYAGRLWVAPEGKEDAGTSRLRFIVSPAGLANLIAVISAFLPMAAPALLLRLIRLLRLVRVAKLGRMSRAWSDIAAAISQRREALALSFGFALAAILLAATALYLLEGQVQPQAFGSIPRAAWWAVATLTTIGYGDVYAVTIGGRMVGAAAAIASIGLVALPAGIMAAAFSDAMKRRLADRD